MSSPASARQLSFDAGSVTRVNFTVDQSSHFVLYSADSMGGSSGSPVFSAAFDKMVALHHHGTEPDHPNENRGVLACHIREWLDLQPTKPVRAAGTQIEDEDDEKTAQTMQIIRKSHLSSTGYKEVAEKLQVAIALSSTSVLRFFACRGSPTPP